MDATSTPIKLTEAKAREALKKLRKDAQDIIEAKLSRPKKEPNAFRMEEADPVLDAFCNALGLRNAPGHVTDGYKSRQRLRWTKIEEADWESDFIVAMLDVCGRLEDLAGTTKAHHGLIAAIDTALAVSDDKPPPNETLPKKVARDMLDRLNASDTPRLIRELCEVRHGSTNWGESSCRKGVNILIAKGFAERPTERGGVIITAAGRAFVKR